MIGLHRHSHFSKRDAIAKIPDIIRRTHELGQNAWALTDHGTTSGLIDAYNETMNYNREHGTNIKFIFGVEAYWIPDFFIKDRKLSRHIILLAKNTVGYHNLLKLVTIGYGDKGNQPDNFYYTMRLTTDTIAQYHEGLIATSACQGGILKDRQYAVDRANSFKNIFGDDFYLEIQTATDPEQKDFNLFVLDLSQKLNIKTIVTEDAHYVFKSDADVHRKWIQLDGKTGYYNTDDFYLHSDQQVAEALDYIPNINQIIRQTEDVAGKCEQVHISFGEKHFPAVDVDNPKKAVVRAVQVNKLDGISEDKKEIYRQRFKHELDVLEQCDYLTYFIINARLVKWCRDNDIQVGRGRGSVCGSLVAYLLDITRVDPIAFGLVFERFANPERVTPPDIDTDVPNSKRHLVIQYLKNTYRQVYRVRTFGTTADKAAVQRAAKALGHSAADIRALSKQTDTIDDISDKEVKSLATSFNGLVQHFGVHASALIIFPSEPADFCAIEKQGDDYVCAYQFPDLERMGLLKLDILGMKTLDTIDETVKLVEQRHGIKLDLDNLPFDDKKTFEMLCDGDTLGCFQIESDGMTKIIKQLQPQSLFELVPLVALYRPSSIQSGVVEAFIGNLKSKRVNYIHPKLKPVLKDTFGVLLYQEQAMQIVQLVADYSLAKADVFRRAIGHKDNEQMQRLIEQFVVDGENNGFDRVTMLKLAEWLKNCASYQFNKSHSAAYALLCYQTAYLKANFSLEFFIAFLNAHHDDKQEVLLPYVRYIKNHGIKIQPPDVSYHSSGWHINGAHAVTAVNFIKGVGDIALPLNKDNIAHLPKNKLVNLIKAGAFDNCADRRRLVEHFFKDDFLKKKNQLQKKIDRLAPAHAVLFANQKEDAALEQKYQKELRQLEQDYVNLINKEKFQDENEVLGFAITSPFEQFDLSQFDEPDTDANDKRIVLCLIRRFKAVEKNSGLFAFTTIETPEGKFFDLFMPTNVYEPLPENSFCIISMVKNKIVTVVSKNVKAMK